MPLFKKTRKAKPFNALALDLSRQLNSALLRFSREAYRTNYALLSVDYDVDTGGDKLLRQVHADVMMSTLDLKKPKERTLHIIIKYNGSESTGLMSEAQRNYLEESLRASLLHSKRAYYILTPLEVAPTEVPASGVLDIFQYTRALRDVTFTE